MSSTSPLEEKHRHIGRPPLNIYLVRTNIVEEPKFSITRRL